MERKSIEVEITSILFLFLWHTRTYIRFQEICFQKVSNERGNINGELEEHSVIRKFRITASDGKIYNTNHYNLKAIIAVGNKVDSPRAVQFRKWANGIIEEFTIKGYTMDDERLKNFGPV